MKSYPKSVLIFFGATRLLLGTRAIAAEPPPTAVVLVDHTKVDAAFGRGEKLLGNSLFKVHAGRRVKPGAVEIHAHDTDIFYILEGAATFITGGTAVDRKETQPGEYTASSITGGDTRHLEKGDVIVIPKGIPHQYTEVGGTFLYFVVKVTD